MAGEGRHYLCLPLSVIGTGALGKGKLKKPLKKYITSVHMVGPTSRLKRGPERPLVEDAHLGLLQIFLPKFRAAAEPKAWWLGRAHITRLEGGPRSLDL